MQSTTKPYSRSLLEFTDSQRDSDFREVPDHQEVYVSMTDGVDISIIFDIALRVEAPAGPSDMDAVDFHFEDVAMDQDRSAKVFSKRAVTLPNLFGPHTPPSPTYIDD